VILSTALITAIIAAAAASAGYVFISTAAWSWRMFFANVWLWTVILFVLLTGGLIKIG
jgi:hypothetical protein